jgi:hypothetical protein
MPVTPQQLKQKAKQDIATQLIGAVKIIDEALQKQFKGYFPINIQVPNEYTYGMLYKEIKELYKEHGWIVESTSSGCDPRESESETTYYLVFKEGTNSQTNYDPYR